MENLRLSRSNVADGVKAFGIINQAVDLDEQSIASALLNHGLSFEFRVPNIFMPVR
jgi:hypothetical protein